MNSLKKLVEENLMSAKKLPPEYYVSSGQKARKRFFEKTLPKMMRELGISEEKIKEAHNEIKEAHKRRGKKRGTKCG